MSSIWPSRNSAFSAPASALFFSASSSISSVMSSPYALPPGETLLAESSTSIPPPLPRSKTTSPGESVARAVGFPHPRAALTAPCRPAGGRPPGGGEHGDPAAATGVQNHLTGRERSQGRRVSTPEGCADGLLRKLAQGLRRVALVGEAHPLGFRH